MTQRLLQGQLPLWNPYLFMGVPLLANMQAAVLYPLHWPLLGLPVPKQVAASIVLHVVLAALGTLLYARGRLHLSWTASVAAAVAFALGGFLTAQSEHLNQLNCLAWLPWAFWLLEGIIAGTDGSGLARRLRRHIGQMLLLALVLALMLLAGHAQATFIALTGLGFYALVRPVFALTHVERTRGLRAWMCQYRPDGLMGLALAAALTGLLTAAQLLPTWELARLSVRSEGLSYREATAFSLNPQLLHHTLLPPYGVELSQVFGEAYSEYVAYVGLVGLGLAVLAGWQAWRRQPRIVGGRAGQASDMDSHASSVSTGWTAPARTSTLLAAVGLFLALGRINPFYYLLYHLLPGFAAFRAPARWMVWYAWGMAVLIGLALEWLRAREHTTTGKKRLVLAWLPTLLTALLVAELWLAGQSLRHNHPTAPEAYTLWRPSIAHLKTDPGIHRFLSLSGIIYDPGDLAEMRAMLGGQLPERAVYDYIVAAKQKEVLFYNLPLVYGLYSVDGYDGGLLPLRDFVTLQRLFLPEERLAVDGRLREQLRDVPPGRLLSMLGVKYVITDKVYDAWIDGIYYDLQFSARLSPRGIVMVRPTTLPRFPATALGVVSHLEGAGALPDGALVARLHVRDATGWQQTLELLAGRDTSEGRYRADVAHRQARIGHTWRDDPAGSDYIALIPLQDVYYLEDLVVEAVLPQGELVLRGVSLVDTRTRTGQQLTLSTEGRYRLVHSGDVKIYENLDVLPRALVVHRAEVLPDDEEVLARMRDPTFDPARLVLLSAGKALNASGRSTATLTRYEPEEVSIVVTSDAPGYLVVFDTFYPGWEATVDGQPTPVLRANLAFRAVPLMPGTHVVELRYQPATLRLGSWISAAVWLVWVGLLVVVLRHRAPALKDR
ncbi:MAG: YfhO family protein [Anaerolineae bacterium]|nr:YfhO family protein [Anaerolineae bacterium]